MSRDQENFRGVHAIELLKDRTEYTLDSLIQLAHDPYLPAFRGLITGLVQAYYRNPSAELKQPIETLLNWDFKTSAASVAMTLAHCYGTKCYQKAERPEGLYPMQLVEYWGNGSPDSEKISLFSEVIEDLTKDFGSWEQPWGEVNRYQRLNGDIRQNFDDAKPSIPIGFASGRWGALAAYGARYTSENAKKMYGTRGNSFVAVVEFGEKVKAKTILAGGQSGDPNSPHFDDQIQRYADVNWKDAAYYREDVLKRASKTYRPGERE